MIAERRQPSSFVVRSGMQDALARVAMTTDEFLNWSAQQAEGRYELVDGEIEAMPAEGGLQNVVKGAIYISLSEAVAAAGLACQVFTDGMAIRIDERRAREPDASVSVGPLTDFRALTIADPLIVVEVTSEYSITRDTVQKLSDYFRVPSVVHYLIVHPEQRIVVHHRRLARR